MKFLFLEDNETFVQLILDYANKLNIEVFHTCDVKLSKVTFDQQDFDLAIVDLHLHSKASGGGSGLELISHIRTRRGKNTPIVVTTGLDLIAEDTLTDYDIDNFFYKPLAVPLDEFFNVLTQLAQQKRK